jgi:hypothetical protein
VPTTTARQKIALQQPWLHKAIMGLDAPTQLLVDILKAEPPKE